MSRHGRLVRVEANESVAAVYARDIGEMPDGLFVRLGSVCVLGRPADVADMLCRALRECWASMGAGSQIAACDDPGVHSPVRQTHALPPWSGPSEVDDTLSRGAVAPAELLALDGGAAISDHPTLSGGGIRESFYLIRNEGDGA